MNILFLTITRIVDISGRGIYEDLLRKFRNEGHNLFIVSPLERRFKGKTKLFQDGNVIILKIKTLNIQKTNIIEKGLSIILMEYQFLKEIRKNFSEICFDLVLYSTPPITFTKIVSYIKIRDKAISYLLIKDIFPQNAVDLNMIMEGGLFHRFFRAKEKILYSISDHIGCMSTANIDFIRKQNPEISSDKLEVNPNSIEPLQSFLDQRQKLVLRQSLKIPINTTIFIYGGNLGKPQGIDFLIETMQSQIDNMDLFFIISGSGTEYHKINNWVKKKHPSNALLLCNLPRNEFDELLQVCDVGLIFLDKRFTIPNFPSRLLSYMEFKLPVLAATDKNTDLSKILLENSFGFWSEAGNIESIKNNIIKLVQDPYLRHKMGENGYNYLLKNYTVSHSYSTIIKHFPDK